MTRRSSLRDRHEKKISRLINKVVALGATTLPEVLAHLPGVFPLTVAKHLGVLPQVGNRSAPPIRTGREKLGGSRALLPHPLDYDWRFSTKALIRLSSEIVRHGGEKRGVLCLGCPSVAQHLLANHHNIKHQLFDLNGELHAPGRSDRWDACSRISQPLNSGVVIVDPPWYSPYFREFLWTARSGCEPMTDVLLAGPPWGTRPGCKEEMMRLMRDARSWGYKIIAHEETALPYVMPLFELNTLRSAGLNDVPLDWRKADLWHLCLIAKRTAPPPRRLQPAGGWLERRFGDVRLRIRIDLRSQHTGSSILEPLGANGFLNSVSSRDPKRLAATVVTSGGRFFSCKNPTQFLRLCDTLIATSHQEAAVIRDASLGQLSSLITNEQAEADCYHNLVDAFEHS